MNTNILIEGAEYGQDWFAFAETETIYLIYKDNDGHITSKEYETYEELMNEVIHNLADNFDNYEVYWISDELKNNIESWKYSLKEYIDRIKNDLEFLPNCFRDGFSIEIKKDTKILGFVQKLLS